MKSIICWRNKFFSVGMIVFSMLLLVSCSTGGGDFNVVDQNNGWNNTYIAPIGEIGSDFYAQSFIPNVKEITKFGVVIQQSMSQGEVRLAIAADNGSGYPNVNAPLYSGALKVPSTTGAWFYEENIGVPVTPGQKYWVLIDGYNNTGATGNSRIGVSSNLPNTGEGIFFSNDAGASWGTSIGFPLAIYVEGKTTIE